MNCLMAGMVPTIILAKSYVSASGDPFRPDFWFVMSMALLVGFVTAYPMNWWLVSNHMKHGMMTVRAPELPAIKGADESLQTHNSMHSDNENLKLKGDHTMHGVVEKVSGNKLIWMTLLSFLVLALGLTIVATFGGV